MAWLWPLAIFLPPILIWLLLELGAALRDGWDALGRFLQGKR